MGFSNTIKEDILVKSARHCCVCRNFAGRNVEVHHIIPIAEGGKDTFENAIPLCFDCHSEAGHYNPKHPKGTKYSPTELGKHKAEWFKNVAENKIQIPVPNKQENLNDLINLKLSNSDNEKKLHSAEGFELAKADTEFMKRRMKEFADKLKPTYNQLEFRNALICDLRGYGYTLVMKFYPTNTYPEKYELAFLIYNGYYNEKGESIGDPTKMTLVNSIFLHFSYNENNEFGWRSKDSQNPFYSSQKIIAEWITKYMNIALDDTNLKKYLIR